MSNIGWGEFFPNLSKIFTLTSETQESQQSEHTPSILEMSTLESLSGSEIVKEYISDAKIPDLEAAILNITLTDSTIHGVSFAEDMMLLKTTQLKSVISDLQSIIAGSSIPESEKDSLLSVLTAVSKAIEKLEQAIRDASEKDAEVRRKLIGQIIEAAATLHAQFALANATRYMTPEEQADFYHRLETGQELREDLEMYRKYYELVQKSQAGKTPTMEDLEQLKKMLEQMFTELDNTLKRQLASILLKLNEVNFEESYKTEIEDAFKACEQLGLSEQQIRDIQNRLTSEVINGFLSTSDSIHQVIFNVVTDKQLLQELFKTVGQDETSQRLMGLMITLTLGSIALNFLRATDENSLMEEFSNIIGEVSATELLNSILGNNISLFLRSDPFSQNVQEAINSIAEFDPDQDIPDFTKMISVLGDQAKESEDLIMDLLKMLNQLRQLLIMILAGVPLQEIAKIAGMADAAKTVISEMDSDLGMIGYSA